MSDRESIQSGAIHWELRLLRGLELTSVHQLKVLRQLRKLADDASLQLIRLDLDRSDRPTLVFAGTFTGFQRIRTLRKTHQLTSLLQLPVKDVAPVDSEPDAAAAPSAPITLPTQSPESLIYQSFAMLVQAHPPLEVIDHVQHLIVDTHNIQDLNLKATLDQIVLAKNAPTVFPQFLLHCCLILIDFWQLDPKAHAFIPQLVACFDHLPSPGYKQARAVHRLRELVAEFLKTEQYTILHRIAQLYQPTQIADHHPLGALLGRYPFLFKTLLLNDESDYEQQQTVRYLYTRHQERYEFQLNRFVTYQARLADIARARQLSQGAGRVIRREKNPTLLSDRELATALRHFWDKRPGRETSKELAQRLRFGISHFSSYASFKAQLHQYLVHSLPSSSPYPMSNQLQTYLHNILPRYDQRRPDESLSLRTATKLLGLLMIEKDNNPDHYRFIEAVANLGATYTIGMLMKLTLLSPPLVPELEKRLTRLFLHYQTFPQQDVAWLIQVLENYQLASSIYRGSVDLSPLSHLLHAKTNPQRSKRPTHPTS
ncbi:hypothetical protein PN441_00575 [Spirulina major CS-329]|uniref:hypothetical protein n=1 Tax=Spirulina TaxID=1154 RepID=UPI00232F1FDE|nr:MULTISPECIES: hypothetical protein [Spirulina]MDB9496804.1 hypothetical protein [Spirulina subsalsa CS-330]MDB9501548.1 hypothetical protein [Spirulina major CS-329]